MGPNTVVYQKAAAQACMDVNGMGRPRQQSMNGRPEHVTERFSSVAKKAEHRRAQPPERGVIPGRKNTRVSVPRKDIDDIRIVRLKDRPQIGTISRPRCMTRRPKHRRSCGGTRYASRPSSSRMLREMVSNASNSA
jgi:hypothetical protein